MPEEESPARRAFAGCSAPSSRSAATSISPPRSSASSNRRPSSPTRGTARSACSTRPGTFLSEFLTVGIDAETRAKIGDLPKGHGILGLLIREPTTDPPPRPSGASRQLRLPSQPPSDALVPRRAGRGPRGGVRQPLPHRQAVGRRVHRHRRGARRGARRRRPVSPIDNARLHARVRDLALLEDRERIAMDLHDTVIQQLFAVGLSLQATMRRLDDRRCGPSGSSSRSTTSTQRSSGSVRRSSPSTPPSPSSPRRSLRRRVLVAHLRADARRCGSSRRTSSTGRSTPSPTSHIADEIVIVLARSALERRPSRARRPTSRCA